MLNRTKSNEAYFSYKYGWSFAFAAISFLLTEVRPNQGQVDLWPFGRHWQSPPQKGQILLWNTIHLFIFFLCLKCVCAFIDVRQRAWCRCIYSWSATLLKRCTDPTRASTGLASATAQTTLVSSCTQTPGPAVAAVPPPSPLRLLSRWTPPPSRLCSNVQSTNKCRPRPAEEYFRSGWILA